jgi:hypothetical protein
METSKAGCLTWMKMLVQGHDQGDSAETVENVVDDVDETDPSYEIITGEEPWQYGRRVGFECHS